MKTFSIPRSAAAWLAFSLTAMLTLLSASPALAVSPIVSKLLGKNTVAQSTPVFGGAVAVSDRWVVVGEHQNDDLGANAGAAHVFNATTGAYVRKLKATDGAPGDLFGYTVAVSGNLAIIGAWADDASKGSAYVFDVTTGVQKWKLTDTTGGVAGDGFGSHVAADGNLALIGAPGDDGGAGSAFVFDILTGLQVGTKLSATVGAPGDFFGSAVALSGTIAVIGAEGDDVGANSNQGSAYLFDVIEDIELHHLTASDGAANDAFGYSAAISGNVCVIGAHLDDLGAQADAGSAYVYNVTTGTPVTGGGRINATGFLAGDQFGISVAISGNLIVVGAHLDDNTTNLNVDQGMVHLFEAATNLPLGVITAADGAPGDQFGNSLALFGNTAVIGAAADDSITNGVSSSDTGSAYLYRPLAIPFQLTDLVAKGDFAPNAPETSFSSFTEVSISPGFVVAMRGVLSGTGAAGGKQFGVWGDTFDNMDVAMRSEDVLVQAPLLKAVDVFKPLNNQSSLVYFQARLAGVGVNSLNDVALFKQSIGTAVQLLREDDNLNGGGGAEFLSFPQVVQGVAAPEAALAFNLQLAAGVVTAASDSGVVVFDDLNGQEDVRREGTPATGAAANYGQFVPRVSYGSNLVAYTAALQSPVGTNQGLWAFPPGGATTMVARRSFAPPGPSVSGAVVNNILSEASDTCAVAVDSLMFRATLSGGAPPVTALNNEGLWQGRAGNVILVARKGQQATGLPTNVVFNSFLRYWTRANGTTAMFLAQLRGPGVTAANDMSLWLCQESGDLLMLMREGDRAPECDGSKIGVIQRVEVDRQNGIYAVVASLTGSVAGKNQAFFTGNCSVGTLTQRALRLPRFKLRKGTLLNPAFNTIGTTSAKLLSIALPATGQDATGAGTKGLPSVINQAGVMVLQLTFSDLSVRVCVGIP